MNGIRGETGFAAGGESYRLCLTLGALAEIETGLGVESLAALPERLTRLSARDIVMILAALMRGGGHSCTDIAVSHMPIDPSAAAAAIAVAFEAAGLAAGP